MIEALLPRGKLTPEEFPETGGGSCGAGVSNRGRTSPACDHVQGNLIVARLTADPRARRNCEVEFKSTLLSPLEARPYLDFDDGGGKSAYALFVNCLLSAVAPWLCLRKRRPCSVSAARHLPRCRSVSAAMRQGQACSSCDR